MFCILLLSFVCGDNSVRAAAQVTLAWNPNPEPDVIGYRLHYGTSSGRYPQSVDVGNTTSSVLSGLAENTRYYSVVTAYNSAGLESFPSNEISFVTRPSLPTISAESPDGHSIHIAPATMVLYATTGGGASDVERVEFFEGSTKLGEARVSPWSLIRRNVVAGDHHLTAVVHFVDGTSQTSEPLTVSVEARTAQSPPLVNSEPSKLVPIPIQTILGSRDDDSFLIFVSGQEDEWVRIEKSEDLIHWSPQSTLKIKGGYSYFIDENALGSVRRRYYRIERN